METRTEVNRAVLLPTISFGSKVCSYYESQISQLDDFRKNCHDAISRYTCYVIISKSDLFAKCNLEAKNVSSYKLQLRWSRYVIWMRRKTPTKNLINKQTSLVKQKCWFFRYRGKRQNYLIGFNIPVNIFEQIASIWREQYHKAIQTFERTKNNENIKLKWLHISKSIQGEGKGSNSHARYFVKKLSFVHHILTSTITHVLKYHTKYSYQLSHSARAVEYTEFISSEEFYSFKECAGYNT